MTVLELKERLGLKGCSLPEAEREITGVYIGDLLSWVMGRARSSDAWITIMSNKNIAAVAALTDCACIILAEGVLPDEGVAELAESKGINLLTTEKSAYEIAVGISRVL